MPIFVKNHNDKYALIALLLSALLTFSANTYAVNWLTLQGTEHPLAPSHSNFGFMQAIYTVDTTDNLSGLVAPPMGSGLPDFSLNNGLRVASTTVQPKFTDDRIAQIRSAKFGRRGLFTGDFKNKFTTKMNYLVLFELAPNLMTYDPFGDRARAIALDHLSLTFNHTPGARVRAGLFKTPGSEETFQGAHTFDYVELTDFAAREIIERFVTGAASAPASPASPALGTPVNSSYGINAARDWGVQVFESFNLQQWDLSYAAMLGRGEAIQHASNNNDNIEQYLYLSAEHELLGGRGAKKNGLKFYGWHQQGKRKFSSDPSNTKYDRIRSGIGTKFIGRLFKSQYKYRFAAERTAAKGMLFLAPSGGVANGNINNGNLT